MGMITLEQSIKRLFLNGCISREDVQVKGKLYDTVEQMANV